MSQERAIAVAGRQRSHKLSTDRLIAKLAARQVGRVSRWQLLAYGVSEAEIRSRIASGLLLSERPGVYAVGYQASGARERWATALLAIGIHSILSNFASAAAHGFLTPAPWVVDVTTPKRLPSRPGIRIHTREIHPAEQWRLGDLPLTSPAQTLFDLGRSMSAQRHAKTANQAFVETDLTLYDLYLVMERNPRRKGTKAFRRLLATLDPEGREIRSPPEGRLNAFLRARGFPPWQQNVPLLIGTDRIVPDVLWSEQRVTVEYDGRDPHLAPVTFVSDRRRDRRLQAEGWHPVRATAADLGAGAEEFDADLRVLLGL